MELQFDYVHHDKQWVMSGHEGKFNRIAVQAVENILTDCPIRTVTPVNQETVIEGFLKVGVLEEHTNLGPDMHFRIVSKENPLFEMPLHCFRIDSEHFEIGGALEEHVLFGIPPTLLERTPMVDHMLLRYWQINILAEYLTSHENKAMLRACDGVVFEEAASARTYLALNGLKRPLEAVWNTPVPKPLLETDVGKLYLYKPYSLVEGVVPDDLLVSVEALKRHTAVRP